MDATNNNSPIFPVGCVHGRFQPFHVGHLEYVIRAYEISELLYVGLANSDPTHINADETSRHRHLASSNPYPYFSRMEMVIGSLKEANLNLDRVRIVPYPINKPELIAYYIPKTAVHMITIYDDWGESKLRRLHEVGLKVEVLWRRTAKVTTGSIVRERLLEGTPISGLVPTFVENYVRGEALEFSPVRAQ